MPGLRSSTLFLACALGTHLAHATASRPQHRAPEASALPPAAVRALSFGNASLAADLAYLGAVSAFGDRAEQAAGAPHVTALLRRSVTLDPNFAAPYLLAGGGLAFVRAQDPEVTALLQEGCARCPDVWELQLYRGFWAYQRHHDVPAAAAAFAAAARLPGAPVFLGLLATRLAANTDDPRQGLAVVDGMLQTVADPGLRVGLHQRRSQLLLEHRLGRLNRAARGFAARHGRPPRDAAELLGECGRGRPDVDASAPALPAARKQPGELGPAGDDEPLADALADPFGGTLHPMPDGTFASDHDAERLRLRPGPGAGTSEVL